MDLVVTLVVLTYLPTYLHMIKNKQYVYTLHYFVENTVYRHRQKSSKQYEPERVPAQSLSSSSLAMKNKHSALLNSENDFLKPNTGDIPLETINKIRKY